MSETPELCPDCGHSTVAHGPIGCTHEQPDGGVCACRQSRHEMWRGLADIPASTTMIDAFPEGQR
jgi:hypothetical protein